MAVEMQHNIINVTLKMFWRTHRSNTYHHNIDDWNSRLDSHKQQSNRKPTRSVTAVI